MDWQNQFALSAMPLQARTTDAKVQLPAYPSQLCMKCSLWQSLQYSSQDLATKHNFRPNSSFETSQGDLIQVHCCVTMMNWQGIELIAQHYLQFVLQLLRDNNTHPPQQAPSFYRQLSFPLQKGLAYPNTLEGIHAV